MGTIDVQLDREDVILLLLEANERLLRRSSLNGITRLEKLVFLLERETTFKGIGTFFRFEPYNFGPFSKEVYEAVEFLEGCDLIEVREKTYQSLYNRSHEDKLLMEISDEESGAVATEMRFSLTENGRKVARMMRSAVREKEPSDVDALESVVRKYGALSLKHLIEYVYHRYPEMTWKSIHPEAANVNRGDG